MCKQQYAGWAGYLCGGRKGLCCCFKIPLLFPLASNWCYIPVKTFPSWWPLPSSVHVSFCLSAWIVAVRLINITYHCICCLMCNKPMRITDVRLSGCYANDDSLSFLVMQMQVTYLSNFFTFKIGSSALDSWRDLHNVILDIWVSCVRVCGLRSRTHGSRQEPVNHRGWATLWRSPRAAQSSAGAGCSGPWPVGVRHHQGWRRPALSGQPAAAFGHPRGTKAFSDVWGEFPAFQVMPVVSCAVALYRWEQPLVFAPSQQALLRVDEIPWSLLFWRLGSPCSLSASPLKS